MCPKYRTCCTFAMASSCELASLHADTCFTFITNGKLSRLVTITSCIWEGCQLPPPDTHIGSGPLI
ncbi:hypothetical protein PF005_g14950 [Phytophthora fragariae]|uniref:Uncharacterized protein n=1 Tax=Phytophthora fragariae TaxID=53985 RepID=A0A6A3RQ76_9STRA|nr:hypothetical protein PF003_g27571 [Phytophthora fragariae]KAE8933719.1 hypothetical protein PF009_g16281 [Phytophthora fragariae]KAE8988763.1 hypothetical protein PF011_g19044 [Phytophthora fragariae]KAE9100969.1 hypothetical protein PF007_g15323 [Phytophthora fragariae]KAE9101146.1 hypothetical protein PF010_g14546 [Phytophthora fragariae]